MLKKLVVLLLFTVLFTSCSRRFYFGRVPDTRGEQYRDDIAAGVTFSDD